MKTIDMRFDKEIFKEFIGRTITALFHDSFEFVNSSSQVVQLNFEDDIYYLYNSVEPIDNYGVVDDVAIWEWTTKKYPFVDKKTFITTPINEKIKEIHLVQENQRLYKDGEQTYDVWVTRGIIFFLESGREISFEKAVWFSEDIYINRGYNLIDTFESADDFAEEWEESDGYHGECERKIEVIK